MMIAVLDKIILITSISFFVIIVVLAPTNAVELGVTHLCSKSLLNINCAIR